MKISPRAGIEKENSGEKLCDAEIAERERRVLDHFLTSKPEPHKPLAETARAKRQKKSAKRS